MDKITDEVLLNYIDGLLPEAQVEQVEAVLERDTKIRDRINALKLADSLMKESMEHPAVGFTEKVWGNIAGARTVYKFDPNSFLIIFSALLTVFLGSYFITDSMVEMNLWNLENYIQMPELNILEEVNFKLLSQILLYILSFLILLLLDRIFLRPYFKRRREMTGV